MRDIESRLNKLLRNDPYLTPFSKIIERRMENIEKTEYKLTKGKMNLSDFSLGYKYFGLHLKNNEWIFREWAPNANDVFIIGDISNWEEKRKFSLEKINDDGVWEIHLNQNMLSHGDLFRLRIHWSDGKGDRIPSYATRVVKDPDTSIFNAQVWFPSNPYYWNQLKFK